MVSARNAKRRARRRGADHGCVNTAAVDELLRRAHGRCTYCGDFAQHIDHVHPLNSGGLHCVSNLTPACAACNLSKGTKILDDPPAPLIDCGSYASAA
ncbi:HNH endonuclease [Microbacterium sp. T32]|uniref:HNH endonuclease n=1 Tax=Microbacterium sp. T32 TaxID=1776083 RepID=UPI0009EE543B